MTTRILEPPPKHAHSERGRRGREYWSRQGGPWAARQRSAQRASGALAIVTPPPVGSHMLETPGYQPATPVPWLPGRGPSQPLPPSRRGSGVGGGLRSSTGHRSQAVLLPGPSPTPSGLALGRGGPPGEPAKRVQSLRDRGADVTLSMRTEWQLGHRRQPCLPASFWSHKLKWPSMLPAWPAGLRPLTAFGASDCQRPSGVCPRRAQGSVLPQAQGGGGGARRQSPSEGAHVSWSRSHVPLRQGRASGGRPATGHRLGPEALCGSPFPSR